LVVLALCCASEGDKEVRSAYGIAIEDMIGDLPDAYGVAFHFPNSVGRFGVIVKMNGVWIVPSSCTKEGRSYYEDHWVSVYAASSDTVEGEIRIGETSYPFKVGWTSKTAPTMMSIPLNPQKGSGGKEKIEIVCSPSRSDI
jgi:hypothetical protein